MKRSRDLTGCECIAHDAFRFSLALDLAQDKGEDFAVMVMEAKGWGRIDLTEAEAWVASNGRYCRCERCRPRTLRPLAAPAQQLSLF
ncbi:hypothetical protein [Salipiger thiooxidans]|uniref:hypothetical protein n=1 Tax=Salipiger thiooxidans TaxID=282683 RepID=UPI001CD2612C|nr:hypothetical protein [Salipiger thiooxidans]MCA0848351.1 hypothetical protein [Salipiger thiooxidans]